MYWLLVVLYSYEKKVDRLSSRKRERYASFMIATFANKSRNLGWRPSPMNSPWNHATIYFIDYKGEEMQREVHSKCHYKKKPEGSQNGEIYARRYAKFGHLLLSVILGSFIKTHVCFL